MDLILTKNTFGQLEVTGGKDEGKYHLLKPNTEVTAKIKQSRNIRFHSKFFALLNMTLDNLPHSWSDKIQNIDRMLDEVKIEIGHFDTYFSNEGKEIIKLKSISFASMDEVSFSDFYNRSVNVILSKFIIDDSEFARDIALNF